MAGRIIKKLSPLLVLFCLAGTLVATPVSAQFNPLDPTCQAAGQQDNPICKDSEEGEDPLLGDGVLVQAVNLLSIVAGIIAVIIIIVSGIRLITSNGDPGAFGTARNTIIYAAIGLIVIVLARTLVSVIAGGIG